MRTARLPRLIMIPVWPLQSSGVLYDTYIHQLTTEKKFTLDFNFIWLGTFIYFNTHSSFSLSSLFGSLNLIVRNETSVWVYLLNYELINSNCSVEWWNISSRYSSKNYASSFLLTWNRCPATILANNPFKSSVNLSSTLCRNFIIKTFTTPVTE